jgi:deoxyribonuclease V
MSNLIMNNWNLPVKEAVELQKQLSKKIILKFSSIKINYIAGVDLAYDKKSELGFCSVVIFTFPDLEIFQIYNYYQKVQFPYIPGLLSFREGPIIIKTFEKIIPKPELIIFDGQGIAHQRKLGIASHMGLLLNIPSIGCAKSKLYGKYEEPASEKGSRSYLYDYKDNPIGVVLRTKDNVKPVFISPGNLIGINKSVEIIMKCVTKYRIPKPTRIADIQVAKYKKTILQNQ